MMLSKNTIYLAIAAATLCSSVYATEASDLAVRGNVPSVRVSTDVYKRVPIMEVLSGISFPHRVTVVPAQGFSDSPELKTLVSMMPMRGTYSDVLDRVLTAARLTADYDAEARRLLVRPAEIKGAKLAAEDAALALQKLGAQASSTQPPVAGTHTPAVADTAGFNPSAISAMSSAKLEQVKREMVGAKPTMALLPAAPASAASSPSAHEPSRTNGAGAVTPVVTQSKSVNPVASLSSAGMGSPAAAPAPSSSPSSAPSERPLQALAPAPKEQDKAASPVNAKDMKAGESIDLKAGSLVTEKAVDSVGAKAPTASSAQTPEVWVITGKGESLKKTLDAWSKKAGWSLRWELPASDFNLETSAEIKGSYLEAVESVVAALRGNGYPLRAVAYEGNKVLRITSPNGPLKTAAAQN